MNNSFNSFVYGLIAGGCSLTTIYPSEYIKILSQKNNMNYRDIIHNTYKTNGLLGFYSGWRFACGNIMLKTACQNGLYQYNKKYFNGGSGSNGSSNSNSSNNSFYSSLISGSIIGLICTPLNNMVIRKVTRTDINNNYFRGLIPTLIKENMSLISLFYLYDNLNPFINSSWITGGIVGCISALTNNPIDVILTRQQTYLKAESMNYTIRDLIKVGGMKIFMRGSLIRCIRPIIGRSIMFGVLDKLDKLDKLDNY